MRRDAVGTIAGFIVVVVFASYSASAQTCRTSTVTGGSSTVTLVSGSAVAGTPADTNAIDGAHYQLSNALGLGPNPLMRTMFSNWVMTGATNQQCQNCDPNTPHVAFYGAAFVNPTGQAITVTSATLTSDIDNFTPPGAVGVTPANGWQYVNRRTLRWTGSISVPARGAQDFVVSDTPQDNATNNTTRNAQLTMTVVTSAGTFTSPAFTMTALTANDNLASNAVVTFDTAGANVPTPEVFVPGRSSAAPIDLGVRVAESGDNGSHSRIDVGLQLTVTVPAGWSAISVPTIASPWSAATLAIVQPTATATGQITIRTNARIDAGTATPANSLVIRGTAPRSSVTNLFPFRLSLSGQSRDNQPISSFNDSVVQVLGNGTEAINSEFFSATIGAGPVRQIDFAAALNVINGSGSDAINVQVFNNVTSTWQTIQTVTPGATNVTVARTFTSDFEPYVNAANRMRIRFVSNGTTARTLRIDALQWLMTLGYTVDNAVGVDTNNGNVAHPFRTVAKAASVISGGSAAYVEVGNSQNGTPYDHDISITTSGTASCPTLIQGVINGSGQMPLVRGVVAGVDSGILVAANNVTVDSFQIDNAFVGLYGDIGATGVTFSNSFVRVPDLSYGVLLNSNSGGRIVGNTVDAAATGATFGIWDSNSSGTTIDGNRVSGFSGGGEGVAVMDATSPIVQRNIVRGSYNGIHFAHCTGTVKLYNNTVDASPFLAVYSEGTSGTVQSLNNVLSNSGVGWGWDSLGTVSSDFDDVFNNINQYNYHGAVSPGPNSINADPMFVQSTNPALPAYYRPGSGSPCIDAGTNVGLPFNGARPDIGAVEN